MNLWIDCEMKPITELLEFIVDNRGKSVPTTDKGHILIATNCIRNDHLYPKYEKIRYLSQETYETFFRSHPLPGDIIFVNKGTPGRVCLVPDPIDFCIAQDMIALRANKNLVDSHYLFAVLRSPMIQTQIHNTYVGDVIPHFKKQFMERLLIPLPSMETQKKIGKIYYTICDKIEVNRRINEQLEELAGALFKSWFVDFEPFKDGEFVDSELGMIPKGWKVYQLNELVNIIGGYSYKGNELKESNVAMATIKNFDRNGGFKINGYKEIVPSSKLKDSQIVTLYDVIVAHTDLTQNADIIGNPTMIMSLSGYKQLIISMDLVKVNSKYEEISNGLLYSLLKDERFKNHALGYVNGTTVLHLSKKALPDYRIALPTKLDILVEMSKTLNNIFMKEANNYSEIEYLTTLRDTLLPKLMSGEIDVNEVEI